MPVFEQSIELAASPEQVWKVLARIEALPLWLEGAQRVEAHAEAGPGARFVLRRSGSLHPEQWIVADWEPPRRLRYAEYQRDLQLRLSLAPAGSGTRVNAAWETPRSRGLLEPAFAKGDRRMLERSLERLRTLVGTTAVLE